jgi:hypothetical protein
VRVVRRRQVGDALASLSAGFARLLRGGENRTGSAGRVRLGLEHEFCVFAAGGQVDFGSVIHNLGIGARHLHPGDVNAYWLPSGALVTCDELEAEIALPPTLLRAGFSTRMEASAALGRRRLGALLSPTSLLQGYSTHISVETPPGVGDRVALLFAQRFAPALMLLMNARDSPGLLVRPRPGRTELCAEFVSGRSLRAAVVFAVAGVRACMLAVTSGVGSSLLPPAVRAQIVPCQRRYGWYVDRTAFGVDLHDGGRATQLECPERGALSAQRHLELAWNATKAQLEGCSDRADITAVADVIEGRQPLPIETIRGPMVESAREIASGASLAHGNARRSRQRPGFGLAPVLITWDVTVYLLVSSRRRRLAFACIPSADARRFLYRLLHGDLDRVISDYLNVSPSGRRLREPTQTTTPGLYDLLESRIALLPTERDPLPASINLELSDALVSP